MILAPSALKGPRRSRHERMIMLGPYGAYAAAVRPSAPVDCHASARVAAIRADLVPLRPRHPWCGQNWV